MKKRMICALAALLLMPMTMSLASCADDDEDEVKEETEPLPDQDKNPGGGLLDVPPEVIEKVHEIYGQASIDPQTVKSVQQLAILTSICAIRDDDGPISVTPAKLNGEDITLMTLGGTEFKDGQATTLLESQLAAFGKPNDYLRAAVRLFEDGTVPADKPVLVTGISLGGMIAQQLLGEQQILERNILRGIITFGSPFTLPLDRQNVKVVRFADVHDKVPELGEGILRSGLVTNSWISKADLLARLETLDRVEKISRESKYSEMVETHALSYIEDACWNDIDFLGDAQKRNVLELMGTMKFYDAPKLEP